MVNWEEYKHNTAMDQIAEQMNKMTAHMAELAKQNQEMSKQLMNQPREYYPRRQYNNASYPATGVNREPLRCFRCGEEGH